MTQDLAEAKRWFKLAADQGNEQAKNAIIDCFITTAAVQALDLPDSEKVLDEFRAFRDGWLKRQPFGSEEIDTYYRRAPDWVAQIDRRQDARIIYQWLWTDHLSIGLALLREGNHFAVYARYRAMLAALRARLEGRTADAPDRPRA